MDNIDNGYLSFFGLNANPFPVAPDADHLFVSKHIDQILTEIIHGISARKGFMVLTGDIGLGKTTICRRILSVLKEKGVATSLVFHTAFQGTELLGAINRDFGLEISSSAFGDQMNGLTDFLLSQNQRNRNCAIVIDDAQNLDPDSLELVRMISNLEADQHKLVQILLIGQPELMQTLEAPKLRQLKSRIIIKKEPQPLTLEELDHYLAFKLNACGNQGLTALSKSAVKWIKRYTRGNFRRINILMDRCLYVAFLRSTTRIDHRIVKAAWDDMEASDSQYHYRRWLWGVGLAMVVLSFVGTLYFSTPVVDRIVGSAKAKVREYLQSTGQKASIRPDKEELVNSEKKDHEVVPNAVKHFLDAYRLSDYTQLFYQALKSNRMEDVSAIILSETGFQMIQLPEVPAEIQSKYGVLSFPSLPAKLQVSSDALSFSISGDRMSGGAMDMPYFLFWRPQLVVPRFYYSCQGDEILKFQRLLADRGYYEANIDGVVGQAMMKSVVDFQKQLGIPITGYPDARTVFLLCHQEGKSKHESR